jgi:hypothetical protein
MDELFTPAADEAPESLESQTAPDMMEACHWPGE